MVGLDNLSNIPDWLSDSICRACTGDGDIRRRLYTDSDLAVFSFKRCVVLNGIDLGSLRGDLAERLLPINLHRIDDEDRLDETELWPRWRAAHPQVLGALLDLVAGVAGVLPSVRLGSRPRMADYAKTLAAVDEVLGTNGLCRYLDKQSTLAADSLEGDEFVVELMATITTPFTGTSAALAKLVAPPDGDRLPKGWPANARAVTAKLRRQAPVLRKIGWRVTDDVTRAKVIEWTITPPDREPESAPSREDRDSTPATPETPAQSDPDAGIAGVAGTKYGQSQDATPCARCGVVDPHPGSRICIDCAGTSDLTADQLADLDPEHLAKFAALDRAKAAR